MSANHREATNYYEILEVSADAPQNEIHRAYQRAKGTYSQDNPALYSMFTKEEAAELGRMIEEAYQILGNQQSRKIYDERLMNASPVASGFGGGAEAKATSRTIQNDHEALPDFAPPDSLDLDSEQDFSMRKRESPEKQKSAAGAGRTPLSTYKVDEKFEAEISAATQFDGAFLQKIRLYKNVSLDKMSEATRVSRSYLSAVEANDHRNLPAAVFVRGFIVNMAKNLGLDENKVASSYMKIFKNGLEK